MLKTLRNRAILAQVLPLMIAILVVGVALVYALETRFFLPGLEKELSGDAQFLAELARGNPQVWRDPSQAQALIDRYYAGRDQHVMLLDAAGRLLASNEAEDRALLLAPVRHPGLEAARNGRPVVLTEYNASLHGEVVDIFTPVVGEGQEIAGFIRLTYRYTTIADELVQLRYLIAGVLFLGLLLGSVIGLVLALTIERPIEQATRAIYDLARGEREERLPERGAEEMRLLARAVNHLVERLHTLEQTRRQLLANLVHELGRPLGALHLGLEVVQRGAKKDARLLDELLSGMVEETERLQHLLDDLSHLHQQVFGELELNRQPIALVDWLPGVLRPWQETARQNHLEWRLELPEKNPGIRADPVRLAQAVENLVSNAIKYTTAGGSVVVATGEKDDQVWISVSDTGPGIPAEEQEKIFLPFYRGDQGQRVKQGMGLGLAIARDLVIAHGGALDLESTPTMGSKFTIWLPK